MTGAGRDHAGIEWHKAVRRAAGWQAQRACGHLDSGHEWTPAVTVPHACHVHLGGGTVRPTGQGYSGCTPSLHTLDAAYGNTCRLTRDLPTYQHIPNTARRYVCNAVHHTRTTIHTHCTTLRTRRSTPHQHDNAVSSQRSTALELDIKEIAFDWLGVEKVFTNMVCGNRTP